MFQKCNSGLSYIYVRPVGCGLLLLSDTKICKLVWFEEVFSITRAYPLASISIHSFCSSTATLFLKTEKYP